jgi:hypothetical protein
VIATVQVADLGVGGAARALTRPLRPRDVPGLRWSKTLLFAPLALSGSPPLGRVGLLALWDDDDTAARFVASHPVAHRFSGGLHARLRPLRAHGSWPGLPDDVPRSRAVPHDGPVAVLTLGRLRISQTVRFLRTSRPAERSATAHDGLLWGSAAVRPPYVATVSIWSDSRATAAYAYGQQQPAHHDAIAEQQRADFHHQSAFIRFAPVLLEGALGGSNPFAGTSGTSG